MAQTKTLRFKRYWGEAVNVLWSHINKGWSVVSASYLNSKKEFTVELSEKSWPTIMLACCGCGSEYPPRELVFKPSPSRSYYCLMCNTEVNRAAAVKK